MELPSYPYIATPWFCLAFGPAIPPRVHGMCRKCGKAPGCDRLLAKFNYLMCGPCLVDVLDRIHAGHLRCLHKDGSRVCNARDRAGLTYRDIAGRFERWGATGPVAPSCDTCRQAYASERLYDCEHALCRNCAAFLYVSSIIHMVELGHGRMVHMEITRVEPARPTTL